MADQAPAKKAFTIMRAKDAPGLMQAGCMNVKPFSPMQRAGMDRLVKEGLLEGEEIKVLCDMPGFSLTHAWLKKDYPLTLHTHDLDCLYYIVAGSLTIGTETLGARDSFFIPGGVPYSYRPGPDGVEVLEFRHAPHFDFINLANGEAFWAKAAETVAANVEGWRTATPPSQKN